MPRVPVQNESLNRTELQVIGNKEDTIEGHSSIMGYSRAAAAQSPFAGTTFYVDDALGSATGDGLHPGSAFSTISLAMTAAAALATRGRVKILVAPGSYAESVVTPLNTECPFGSLEAWTPTGRSFGAAWIQSPTALTSSLIVRARGWKISGFEIASVATTAGIWLDGSTASSSAQGTEISNCIIGGWATANSIGIDITGNGAPLTVLRNCHFNGIRDSAIKCTSSGTDQPRFWEIDRCTFVDNSNHINMNPRGFKESVIHNCRFMQIGANYTATAQLDNRGGNATVVTNNFLSGTYDGSAGGYYDGANAEWGGNWNIAGLTAANPA